MNKQAKIEAKGVVKGGAKGGKKKKSAFVSHAFDHFFF
jgi:hypothetical protein